MRHINNVSDKAHFKKRARLIQNRFKEFGIEIKLGHALEAQAIATGHPNWATIAGTLAKEACQQEQIKENIVKKIQSRTKELFLTKANELSFHYIHGYIRQIAFEEVVQIKRPLSLFMPAFGAFDCLETVNLESDLKGVLEKYFVQIGLAMFAELIEQSLTENPEYAIERVYNYLARLNRHQDAREPLKKAQKLTLELTQAGSQGNHESNYIAVTYVRELPPQIRRFMRAISFQISFEDELGIALKSGLNNADIQTVKLLNFLSKFDLDRFHKISSRVISLL